MRETLAPDVDHGHLVRLREEVDAYQTAHDQTAQEEQHVEPQKVCVLLPCEDECLYLGDGDECEVHVEDGAKAELAHEEERSEGPPQVQLHKGQSEGVVEQLRTQHLQGYQ